MLGSNRLRVKLKPEDRTVCMSRSHDLPIGRLGNHLESVRQAILVDRKTVIANDVELLRHLAKEFIVPLTHLGDLAMHDLFRGADPTAESLPNRLMPQTNPKNGQRVISAPHDVHADTGLIRRTGTGRQDDGLRAALSGGLGGGYSFARAAMGSQQAYNRYLIGGASGAEYAALRARQFFGVQQMPVRQGMGQTGQASGSVSSGAGSQMLAQLARLGRLGRR